MKDIISPYLEIAGIRSAALVSIQGLLVTGAGEVDLNQEVLAAYTSVIMTSAASLADELDAGLLKSVYLELPGRILFLARVSDDLFLVLVGDGTSVLAKTKALPV